MRKQQHSFDQSTGPPLVVQQSCNQLLHKTVHLKCTRHWCTSRSNYLCCIPPLPPNLWHKFPHKEEEWLGSNRRWQSRPKSGAEYIERSSCSERKGKTKILLYSASGLRTEGCVLTWTAACIWQVHKFRINSGNYARCSLDITDGLLLHEPA